MEVISEPDLRFRIDDFRLKINGGVLNVELVSTCNLQSETILRTSIKCLNREAVAPQSPGLPRFGGYPGK
jgi:hypothetical protein